VSQERREHRLKQVLPPAGEHAPLQLDLAYAQVEQLAVLPNSRPAAASDELKTNTFSLYHQVY